MSDFVERKIGDLTVRVDRSACIASSNCMVVADELFLFDDENICAFSDDQQAIDSVKRDRVIEACKVCPVEALLVFDAEGKQLVP